MTPVPWATLGMDEPGRCERFISILLLRKFPNGSRRRPSRGDGGIDVIVPIDEAKSAYDVYQIKYFFSNLSSGQKTQVEESAAATKASTITEKLTIRNWYLTVPIDPTREQQQWLDGLFKDTEITPYWMGLSHLEGLCAEYQDVVDYYVFNSKERVEGILERAWGLIDGFKDVSTSEQVDFAVATRIATELFDRLNNQDRDPHYRYDLAVEGVKPDLNKYVQPWLVMSQWTAQSLDGPFVVVNVFARYELAPEDSPIRGHIKMTASEGTAAAQAIEDFRIYGTPLALGPENAEVSTEDPLAPAGAGSAPTSLEIGGPTPSPTAERQKLVISDHAGKRIATAAVELVERSFGPSGKGGRVQLRTASGSLTFDWRTRLPDEEYPTGLTNFNAAIDWRGRVGAEVVEDVKFASALQSGNTILIGPQYGGQLHALTTLSDVSRPVPDWLERYCFALSVLQEYAEGPLVLQEPASEDEVLDIKRAIALGAMVDGTAPAQQKFNGLLMEMENASEVADAIERDGGVNICNALISPVSGVTVTIPAVVHIFSGVRVAEKQDNRLVLRPVEGDEFVVDYVLQDEES